MTVQITSDTASKQSYPFDFCVRIRYALRGSELRADENRRFALLYELDAVEYLYSMSVCDYHRYGLYHLSSSAETNEAALARQVLAAMRGSCRTVGLQKHAGHALRPLEPAVYG